MKYKRKPRKILIADKEPRKKLPYKKPKLTHFGNIRNLTRGFSGGTDESGQTMALSNLPKML